MAKKGNERLIEGDPCGELVTHRVWRNGCGSGTVTGLLSSRGGNEQIHHQRSSLSQLNTRQKRSPNATAAKPRTSATPPVHLAEDGDGVFVMLSRGKTARQPPLELSQISERLCQLDPGALLPQEIDSLEQIAPDIRESALSPRLAGVSQETIGCLGHHPPAASDPGRGYLAHGSEEPRLVADPGIPSHGHRNE